MHKPIPFVKDDHDLRYKGQELTRPLKVKQLKAVVVGTGRCGTVYLAKLLSSAGLPCGHESVFRVDGWEAALRRLRGEEDVGVSLISQLASISDEEKGTHWFNGADHVEADSSYLAVPFLGEPELKDVRVIHVVRNPIQVINSFVVGFKYFRDDWKDNPQHKPYHEFIYRYLPEVEEASDPISRAGLYIVHWNAMIERAAGNRPDYIRFNVEKSGGRLLGQLGLNTERVYANKECNHRIDMPNFIKSPADIPDKGVGELVDALSWKYGYRRTTLI